MVFNSFIVLSVAHTSADAWQQIACIRFQDRVSSHQLLDLICFPLQELGHLALYLWTFLCLPPPDAYSSYAYHATSDDDDDDDDDDGDGHYPTHDHDSSSSFDLDNYYYNSHSD
ncbi:hypothetical protein Tsubulata_015070 [Turnera subulata]|uniref:Uncharacterized protein n=1 Tax=Turnera subulata TaxID=218843 RepID=A0A9Q0G818_9ROSI|nr:hypothetical protein Tsubulata_015070 [Turnera subulata]